MISVVKLNISAQAAPTSDGERHRESGTAKQLLCMPWRGDDCVTAVRFNEHLIEEHGPPVFQYACKLGLEGIVSKRRDSPYNSGRSRARGEARSGRGLVRQKVTAWHKRSVVEAKVGNEWLRARITRSEYEAKKTGKSKGEIKRAIKRAGPSRKKVEKALRRKK